MDDEAPGLLCRPAEMRPVHVRDHGRSVRGRRRNIRVDEPKSANDADRGKQPADSKHGAQRVRPDTNLIRDPEPLAFVRGVDENHADDFLGKLCSKLAHDYAVDRVADHRRTILCALVQHPTAAQRRLSTNPVDAAEIGIGCSPA